MFQRISKKTLGTAAGVLVLCGSAAWAAAASAQQAAPFARGPARMLDRMAVVLDLSDQQREQIRSIFESKMQTARPLFQQARQNHEALQQAIESGKTDAATLQPLADQVGKTASQLALLRAQTAAEVSSVLTPEQREKAKKLHDLFLEHFTQNWMR